MSLIELRDVSRTYAMPGGVDVHALRRVNLRIERGEFVAIIGASGSGKSTLMNVLGGLDRPNSGQYLYDGVDVAQLSPNELARLRSEHFGFVFQQFHLLSTLRAQENVEMAALYAARGRVQTRARASELLARLGLGERAHHYPRELSGGQQQRVSVARALMNAGELLLADEPTGALDSTSGRELLELLRTLNAEGHTIVLVTHDANVARAASRCIEFRDGEIISDVTNKVDDGPDKEAAHSINKSIQFSNKMGYSSGLLGRLTNALKMSFKALFASRLRSILSILGVCIGVFSVVAVAALSYSAQAQIQRAIRGVLGSEITVYSGGATRSTTMPRAFTNEDIASLRAIRGVVDVFPEWRMSKRIRRDGIDSDASIIGLRDNELNRSDLELKQGRGFADGDRKEHLQVAIIETKTVEKLFANDAASAIGETIAIDGLPFRVIGVAKRAPGFFTMDDWQPRIFVPQTTFNAKLSNSDISRLSILVDASAQSDEQRAQNAKRVTDHVKRVLISLHGSEDFSIFSREESANEARGVLAVMAAILIAIAAISLVVGGIGIMNIMLVTVVERTSEIGLRMAIGARRSDISLQFLVEATVLSVVGATIGTLLAWLCIVIANAVQNQIELGMPLSALAVATTVAVCVGVLFGFWPARKAARLDPAQALGRA